MEQELLAAFGIGVGATLTPCALPLYPGFLAYLAARAEHGASVSVRWLGAVVLAGVLTAMAALGALIAALSLAVGQVLVVVTPLADLAVVAFGVLLVLGRNPFGRVPQLGAGTTRGGPVGSAYAYGLLYGPIALPCSGPLLVSIFALSLGVAELAAKLLFFVVFGVGFGLPLLVLSLLADGHQRALLRTFTRHYAVVSRLAGAALIGVGSWALSNDLPFALLYLGI